MSAQSQLVGVTELVLPIDIFLDIFAYLPLQDILSVRKTCKVFLAATSSRSTWLRLIHIYESEHDLPVELDIQNALHSLSATTLEHRLRRAIELRRNWSSPTPQPSRHVTIKHTTTYPEQVFFLSFLPGRGGRWLLSVSEITGHADALIRCWDSQAHPPTCSACVALRHTVGSVVVNADPKAEAIFALQTRVNGNRGNIEIFTIDFGDSKFVKGASTIRKIRDIQNVEPLSLQGSTIAVRDMDRNISLWNIDDLSAPKIKLCRRQVHIADWGLRPDAPEAILFRPTYAIIAYTTSVEIYPLPDIPQGTLTDVIVEPIAHHKWQWPLNRVCMVEQGYSHLQHDPEATPRPVDLLIRFGSVLPWPINIVHHFVLRVNPEYQPSLPVTAINVPYLLIPQLMQSLSSPIRLFFSADMALGPYGTALIIDSNQDESQSDLAQRLAGQMLCRLGNGSGSDYDMIHPTPSHAIVAEEPVSGFPSMAFLVRDQDTWTRVTMDEQAGKIAFARIDGGVELLEYI